MNDLTNIDVIQADKTVRILLKFLYIFLNYIFINKFKKKINKCLYINYLNKCYLEFLIHVNFLITQR